MYWNLWAEMSTINAKVLIFLQIAYVHKNCLNFITSGVRVVDFMTIWSYSTAGFPPCVCQNFYYDLVEKRDPPGGSTVTLAPPALSHSLLTYSTSKP